MIRVGRTIYNKDGSYKHPSFDNFTSIVVLMKSHSKWGDLGPYDLKDEKGRIFENVWQFSKVYEKVPKTVQRYSRYNKKVIWDHPAETHIKNGKITEEYKAWRKKGMNNKYHLRYPVGFHNMKYCKYALAENEDGTINPQKLNYIEGRFLLSQKHAKKAFDRLTKIPGDNKL